MSITSPMVLVPELLILRADELAEEMRAKCGCGPDDFVVTRPRSRKQSCVVSRDVATLLTLFRSPTRIVDAVVRLSSENGSDSEQTLEQVFLALQPFLQARWLVIDGSHEARTIESLLQAGDDVDGWEVTECVNLLEDTEVYQVRANGTIAALKLGLAGSGVKEEATILERLKLSVAPKLLGKGTLKDREYILMEWCAGISVAQFAAEARHLHGASAQQQLLSLCCDVVSAFATLHAQRIVHGDVYAKNILVDAAGKISIIDYGSARIIDPHAEPTTLNQTRRAVPEFYEPEFAAAVLRNETHPPVSFASEQYAIAVLVDLLFAGSPYLRFSGEREAMLRQIAEDAPLTFAERGAPAWPVLEAVIRKALAKEPASRFASVDAFLRALRSCSQVDDVSSESRSGPHVRQVADDSLSLLDTDDVRQFPLPSQVPQCSLAYGAAGIAYSLYCVSCLDGDPGSLAAADAWIQRALATRHEANAFASDSLGLSQAQTPPASVFFGSSGMHLVHALVSHAMGDAVSLRVAIDCYLIEAAAPDDHIDLVSGKAGVLISCAMLVDAVAPIATAVTSPVHRLVDLGRLQASDLARACEDSQSSTNAFLGLAHGWAGACYAILLWCEVSGDAVPNTVIGTLDMLEERAVPNGRGIRWPMTPSGGAAHSLHGGWCHGAAGYVQLWTAAWRTLGHARYLNLAERAAWTTWEAEPCDASLCCGYTGRAYALLRMFTHTGSRPWLSRAIELRDRALEFRRNRQLDYSLLKGGLGIALLTKDLAVPHSAAFPFIERNTRAASMP